MRALFSHHLNINFFLQRRALGFQFYSLQRCFEDPEGGGDIEHEVRNKNQNMIWIRNQWQHQHAGSLHDCEQAIQNRDPSMGKAEALNALEEVLAMG